MAESEEMVAFRLPPADRAAIQRLVTKGSFHNRSDFFRYAVKQALKEAGEAYPALPQLDLESVDLPVSAPTQGRRHAPRQGKEVQRR